jgi:hypothetical protein
MGHVDTDRSTTNGGMESSYPMLTHVHWWCEPMFWLRDGAAAQDEYSLRIGTSHIFRITD